MSLDIYLIKYLVANCGLTKDRDRLVIQRIIAVLHSLTLVDYACASKGRL